MVALLIGGIFTERMFGNAAFLTLYLLSAIAGNLASVASQPFTVSAGASGAIFGVYGALVGLLLLRRKSIPAGSDGFNGQECNGFYRVQPAGRN